MNYEERCYKSLEDFKAACVELGCLTSEVGGRHGVVRAFHKEDNAYAGAFSNVHKEGFFLSNGKIPVEIHNENFLYGEICYTITGPQPSNFYFNTPVPNYY